MTISRREFLSALAVASIAAAPNLAWARVLAPFDPEADPTIFANALSDCNKTVVSGC